jgi:5-methylcytosine-specific restriction endonuclease McrA
MDVLRKPVLVLNNAFEPINICSVKRAMVLVMKGAAVVQENHEQWLRTAKLNLPVPSVVRLLRYRSVPRHSRSVSRKNIFIRDGHACQYCGSVLPSLRLTLDHVIPRSRGGRSEWQNLVTCCYPCNNRKGNLTPEEAGMILRKRPTKFGIHQKHHLIGSDQESWQQYLFY